MAKHTCPNCAHVFTTTAAKKPKADIPILSDADVNTAAMDLKTLFAHYKATAPLEDVRFFLRIGSLSPAVRAGLEALELAILHTKPSRQAIYREYGRLQDRWRAESNARDRGERDQHATDCPARTQFNALCDCGRASLPRDVSPAVVERFMVDRILAAYGAPAVRGLLCA